jgi:hypothetical protein
MLRSVDCALVAVLLAACGLAGCTKKMAASGVSLMKMVNNVETKVSDVEKTGMKVMDTFSKVDDDASAVVDGVSKGAGLLTGKTSGSAASPDAAKSADDPGPTASAAGTRAAPSRVAMADDASRTYPTGGDRGDAAAFTGNWLCAASVDLTPTRGNHGHFQGSGPWMVVDNGDGSISLIDPRNRDQCPPPRWLVSRSSAKVATDQPCTKPDGSVVRPVRGDATLSGNGMTVDAAFSVSGLNPMLVALSMRCGR